jgi:hypothetical protein
MRGWVAEEDGQSPPPTAVAKPPAESPHQTAPAQAGGAAKATGGSGAGKQDGGARAAEEATAANANNPMLSGAVGAEQDTLGRAWREVVKVSIYLSICLSIFLSTCLPIRPFYYYKYSTTVIILLLYYCNPA